MRCARLQAPGGGVSIEALELFVEVLSQSERAASGDDFYDRLCEAVCRLARMRRAVIFRYDAARRRVRAAGAHGLDLEQFADAHVTVESAPFAAQALRRGQCRRGRRATWRGQIPDEYMALFPEPVRLVCAPMAASDRAIGVILADRLMSAPPVQDARAPPPVDAGQGGGARVGGAVRGHFGRARDPARAAYRPGAGDPRRGDPAPVRRVDGARRRRRSARRGARGAARVRHKRRWPICAARSSARWAARPARPRRRS